MHIQRLVTVHDLDVVELPRDLQVLSDLDMEVIQDSSGYFKRVAQDAKFEWLRDVLQECGDSGWRLEFYSAGEEPLVPYFRFEWGGGPAICLPRGAALRPDLPDVLRHFYTLVGGFQENEFQFAGGVDRPDQLCSIAEMGVWVSDENQVDPKKAISFLQSFSGSQLCYLPDGQGAWLTGGKFEPVENLEAEMERYFKAILDGTRI